MIHFKMKRKSYFSNSKFLLLICQNFCGNNKITLLKKTKLYPFRYIFLLIICCNINTVFAQKITIRPEVFNLKELAERTSTQSLKKSGMREVDGGWRYMKGNMPIPKNAKIFKQKILANALPNGANSIETPSPPPVQGFLGYIDPIDVIPPDCMGAVGLNEVVTATNEYVIVHAKVGGAVLSKVTYSTFFNNPAGMSDPYIQFDPYINRYWISGISTTTTNKVFIAVSQTSDPMGNWYRYSFTPSSTDGSILLDHPYLGFDNKLLVVTGRKFLNASSFTGPILFAFDKASLAAGNPINFGTNAQTIEKTAADGDVPCPVTAMNLTTPATTFYIVQDWNGASSAIRLSTITGTIPNLTWNTGTAVFPSGGSPWSDAQLGNLAPQLGESRLLAVNDARISSAQMVNGKIWCAHHIGLPASNFNHTAIQWWQLSTTGAVLQRGRIDDPTGAISRYYPTIAVNQAEDVLIGYTISSPTTRVNAAYSTRTVSTPADTTNDEYVFKGGISTYWKDYGSGRARWGDYSHSVVDPVTEDLWTIQQYADQRLSSADNDSRYGVWWAQVSFAVFDYDAMLSNIINPNASNPYCDLPITPKVTVKNLGLNTLTTVKMGVILDGITIDTTTLAGLSIPLYSSQDFTLPVSLNPPAGTHTLQVYTSFPDDSADQRSSNDTSVASFTVVPVLPVPNIEGFENATFPPPGGWFLFNPDGGLSWQRTTAVSKSGLASMELPAFDYQTTQAVDILQSPKIDISDVDSVRISFDVAYAQYDANSIDSLQIIYSTDCGATWQRTSYNKGGSSLSTVNGNFVTTSFAPTTSQWRHESLSISTCHLNSSSIVIGIKSINDFGNNIYVDNVAINKLDTKTNNAGVLSINEPSATLCGNDFVPQITLENFGSETLNNVTINYRVDNGTIGTFNYSGALAKCDVQNVTLNSITSSPGRHLLSIFTTNPNGTGDQYTANDTAQKTIQISPLLDAPVSTSFESANFPPDNWSLSTAANDTITWEKTTTAADSGIASMEINNFTSAVSNTVNKFYSPVVNYNPSVDSFFVSFDYAYSPGAQYPGSTNLPLDTMEIDVTTDCGVSLIPVWKKWGADLQTTGNPNLQVTTSFTPNAHQWQHINIYLSPKIGTSNFQVYFVAKSNHQNNLFVDNINIYSKTLPARLKEQGYLLYPNPFIHSFVIHHYHPPVNLQNIGIYNSVGQLVWAKNLNGSGITEMTIDMSKFPSGMYFVKMQYTDKTVTEKMVKQ